MNRARYRAKWRRAAAACTLLLGAGAGLAGELTATEAR